MGRPVARYARPGVIGLPLLHACSRELQTSVPSA